MAKHFTAALTAETADAIASNNNHCVTGFYFYKFLNGIKVGSTLIPIKVALTGEFATKMGCEGKVITIREDGFYPESVEGTPDVRIDDIETINLVLGETNFKFGVRFKWENTPVKVKMYVN